MSDDKPTPAATPAAAELAADAGIDLAEVEGSGADGRVLKDDVVAAAPLTVAAREASEKMPATRHASESGDPLIQQIIANRHAHHMMGDTAQVKALDDHLAELGYEV